MRQLRQVVPIEAQLQLQGDRRGELQLVQARLPQQRGVLQRAEDRRELRAGYPRVHHRAAILDREAAEEGQLQEQLEEIAEEEEVWQRCRHQQEEIQGEGEGQGAGEGPGKAVGGEADTNAVGEAGAGFH